jgi:hypothetical protein
MTSAILFYGIIYDKINKMPWDKEQVSWKEFILRKLSKTAPVGPFQGHEEEYKKYWNDRHSILSDIGVTPEIYGEPKARSYAFCITDSLYINSDPYPDVVTVAAGDGWDKKLKRFCELIEVEYKKPAWYLTYYKD